MRAVDALDALREGVEEEVGVPEGAGEAGLPFAWRVGEGGAGFGEDVGDGGLGGLWDGAC